MAGSLGTPSRRAVVLFVSLVLSGLLAAGTRVAVPPPATTASTAAAPALPGAPPTAPAGYAWPLPGSPEVARGFDPPPQPWLAGHRGVDLAATAGVPVRSVAAGTVHYAGELAGRGVVSVRHADGLRTTYEPVRPDVAAGDRVDAGQRLGTLLAGHRGCPAAACLHWGLRHGEVYLDPLTLLGQGRVRLLPVAPRQVPASPRHRQSASTASSSTAGTRMTGRTALMVATVATMTKARQAVGAYGERLAAQYLTDSGLVLLERNWRSSAGEIDIVARDGDTLVFCEVKTRRSPDFGTPAEAVDARKAARLRRLAGEWLAARELRCAEIRVDVVEVLSPPRGRARVQHLRGVC